jgi:hypothetical protein
MDMTKAQKLVDQAISNLATAKGMARAGKLEEPTRLIQEAINTAREITFEVVTTKEEEEEE